MKRKQELEALIRNKMDSIRTDTFALNNYIQEMQILLDEEIADLEAKLALAG